MGLADRQGAGVIGCPQPRSIRAAGLAAVLSWSTAASLDALSTPKRPSSAAAARHPGAMTTTGPASSVRGSSRSLSRVASPPSAAPPSRMARAWRTASAAPPVGSTPAISTSTTTHRSSPRNAATAAKSKTRAASASSASRVTRGRRSASSRPGSCDGIPGRDSQGVAGVRTAPKATPTWSEMEFCARENFHTCGA